MTLLTILVLLAGFAILLAFFCAFLMTLRGTRDELGRPFSTCHYSAVGGCSR
jgi:hypothetical protein